MQNRKKNKNAYVETSELQQYLNLLNVDNIVINK